MPNLLAMCFEGELSPTFDLQCLRPGSNHPDGWGLGYYPPGEPSVALLKEPAPTHASSQAEVLHRGEGFADEFLVLERAVYLCCVEERYAAFYGGSDDRDHRLLFSRRTVARAHAHAAQPDGRNPKIAASECALVHVLDIQWLVAGSA